MYIIILVTIEQPIPMLLVVAAELSQFLRHSYNKSILPSGFHHHCSHPTTDTRTLMWTSFCVSGLCYKSPASDTAMGERQTHLGLWTTDRAFRTEGLSMVEYLPKHSGLLEPDLFLNRGGGGWDGTRDDNIVFFTLRETLQWYEPNGIWQMRMGEAISSSAQGEHEGTVLMLM